MIEKCPSDSQLPKLNSVYVVEDEKLQRFALQSILEHVGFQVTSFVSAEDMLTVLDDLPGGCVITDLNLPGKTGLELQAEILKQRSDVRVILMTAGIDASSREAAMQAGAIAVLDKLTWYEVIEETVNRALRSASAEDATV